MERLIKDKILPDLDFSDFDTCVDYIKGKLAAKVWNAKIDDVLSCLGLFIQIFVSHSLLFLWVSTNISSRSLMIIPVMCDAPNF